MPANVRVTDLAKEVGMETKELLALLQKDFNLRVRTTSSAIPVREANRVKMKLRFLEKRKARPDRKTLAAEAIRKKEALKAKAAEAARAREKVEAEQKSREEAEQAKKDEAERKIREEAAEAQAQKERDEKLAAEAAAEESRVRAAAERAAEAARREEVAKTRAAAAGPEASPSAPREADAAAATTKTTTTTAIPVATPATTTAIPVATPASTGARAAGAQATAAPPAKPEVFRPGATERRVAPAVVVRKKMGRRATPPRMSRATPPPMRRTPGRPGGVRRDAPGGRRPRRRRALAAVPEATETLEGLDSGLASVPRGPVIKEYRTTAEVELSDVITVTALGKAMKIPSGEVIKALLVKHGLPVSINQPLDAETAGRIVEGFGGTIRSVEAAGEEVVEVPEEDRGDLVERAPVVTVMGHVDHGKTSLLDAIREARVVETEAGGITQHMSAYAVETDGRRIVFLDTPGHEAFTKMRARGAGVTDVVVLVVAADDGVKEQTIEALNHARAAEAPVVVAVNKMDRETANPDQVMRQLAERGLTPEAWGGDTIFVQVSAKTRDGLDELLAAVLDVAELEEPTADPAGPLHGVVLEARKDRGRGPVAQVLIQNGTLRVGDVVVGGAAWGRVRAILDETGRRLKSAPPSTPVEVLGFADVPAVGDQMRASAGQAEARAAADERREKERFESTERRRRLNLANLRGQVTGGLHELPVVLKADVGGSVEAVHDALMRLGDENVSVRIVHAAAGAVTESDVDLAAAANAIVVAFGVRPDAAALRAASREGVDIRSHSVIYHLTEEIEKALAGMLEPESEVVEIGRIEVRQVFQVPRVGMVAGSYVLEGTVPRSARIRLVRDGAIVHEGRIGSLRRFKEDVSSVREGFECGVGIAGYNDVKIGDIIEAFREEQVRPSA